jgi:predicted NBD/HSP70 family sugar kinase
MTARQGRNLLRAYPTSVLAELAADEPERIDAPLVFAAAARGNPAAVTVVAGEAQALGAGVATLINSCNPEKIVLGGGVMEAEEILLEPVTRWARFSAFEAALDRTRIVRSTLMKGRGCWKPPPYFCTSRAEVASTDPRDGKRGRGVMAQWRTGEWAKLTGC